LPASSSPSERLPFAASTLPSPDACTQAGLAAPWSARP
jgi:hypothetical protein